MEMKEFKAESKRLLDLVINSIYTNRDIFLRELISNASDAIDKIYYKTLADESLTFNKSDYYIKVIADKGNRILKIIDTGIGMTEEDLNNNLGVIASSGSFKFKEENNIKDGYDIIGQFGVGFYSAFLVAEEVTVITKALGSDKAYKWYSKGIDGYSIEETEKDTYGTEIILKLKENFEDENYDSYLEEYRLRSLIKKYSDFIRYPIKMDITRSEKKEDSDEYEDIIEEETINSMVPIWKKNKKELKDEDYDNFYREKHYGFDNPLKHLHISVDGAFSYNAILYIPENMPFDFYTKEYKKGLELYCNGVLIMEKCEDLLPDYFSFVKGVVDSPDLSLNISREILQQDRQLKLIAKNIKNKIKNELISMMENDRDKYIKFYESFGRNIKFGVYNDYGVNKDELKDLIMFPSSKDKKLVSLKEYISNMKEDQKEIYYASGESIERIEKLPQIELLLDKGYEILYLTEDVDEFAIKVLGKYDDKEFKSASSADLDLDSNEDKEKKEEAKDLLQFMKETLGDKIKEVKASSKLKNYPVCLSNAGDLSIEMEKVLNQMPNGENVKAEKVLEVNLNHEIYSVLKNAYENDKDKVSLYTNLLYNQALLLEGLNVEDVVQYTNDLCKLMK